MQAIDGSLERLGLDFVDLLFCHRADPNTPIEETVWAMSDIVVERARALLGNVGVDRRRDPRRVAHRRQASPAQAGDGAAAVQPARARARRVRVPAALRRHRARAHGLEPARVGSAHRASTSTASPTAAAARSRLRVVAAVDEQRADQEAGAPVAAIAADLGCTLAQLALAWCAKNPRVSTVITGASRVSQVHENLGRST